jgi:hypothetical protein
MMELNNCKVNPDGEKVEVPRIPFRETRTLCFTEKEWIMLIFIYVDAVLTRKVHNIILMITSARYLQSEREKGLALFTCQS